MCEIPSGMLADRFSYKANLYLARLASIGSSVLIFTWSGKFLDHAIAMMVNAWSYNFDSGPVRLSYMIQQLKQVKGTAIFRFLAFLSGVAEVTRTLGTVVAEFLCSRSLGLDLSY